MKTFDLGDVVYNNLYANIYPMEIFCIIALWDIRPPSYELYVIINNELYEF